MKEKVLESLKKMGFVTTALDNYHMFEYEGKGYLYSVDDDDDSFLSIALPNIMNAESDDEEEHDDKFSEILKMECEVNSNVKYVKALIVKESLWLTYEREVYAEEDYEQLLPMIISRLFRAAEFVRRELTKLQLDLKPETIEDDVDGNKTIHQGSVDSDGFDQFDDESDDEDEDSWSLNENIMSNDEDYDAEGFQDYEEVFDTENH